MRPKLVDVFLVQKSEAGCCKIEGPIAWHLVGSWQLESFGVSYLLSAFIDGVGGRNTTGLSVFYTPVLRA